MPHGLSVWLFGVNFRWHFAATVLTVHLAFGAAMASLKHHNERRMPAAGVTPRDAGSLTKPSPFLTIRLDY
jgi:hypothetical protein